MARSLIFHVVQVYFGGALRPVVGGSVTVTNLDGSPATVFLADTGPTALTQPLATNSVGAIPGWVDEGDYNLNISGTNLQSYTQRFTYSTGAKHTIKSDSTTFPVRSTLHFTGNVVITDDAIANETVVTSGREIIQPWAALTPYLAGQIVLFNNATWEAIASFTSGATFNAANWSQLGSINDIQVFTANGTWTKPAGARWVHVIVVGGGGSAGSGRQGAAGTVRCGGGGGGGGGITRHTFPASALPSTVAVTVGAAAVGGAAQATPSTDGNPGNPGATSLFGTFARATGGGAGGAGTATGGLGGDNGLGTTPGGLGAAAAVTGDIGNPSAAGAGPSGGASGGGVTAVDVAGNGGNGAATLTANNTSTTGGTVGGAAPSNAAAQPANSGLPGCGGAGGAGSILGAPTAGSNGGLYGAGGGGGGATLNGTTAPKGGNGAAPLVIVTSV